MSELEEKLNALLSDPNSMAQVMQMAQQLSAGGVVGHEPQLGVKLSRPVPRTCLVCGGPAAPCPAAGA